MLSYPDRLLDPLTEALTPESASALLNLRADPDLEARIEELRRKANGDESQWWEYGARLCYWPPGMKDGHTLESWVRVFERHGYTKIDHGAFEIGFEKVAIYVDLDLCPTHVAKQLPDGRWKSKLGKGHDIEHDTVDALEGDQMDEYGIVAQYLHRRLPAMPKQPEL